MGRICTEQALSMLGHYFGEVPEATKAQLRAVFVDEALSPAELETMVRGEGGKSPHGEGGGQADEALLPAELETMVRGEQGDAWGRRGRRPALSRADLEDGDHVSD